MRKIPHPVERKILQPLLDSDCEVMMPLQSIIKEWLATHKEELMIEMIKNWLDELQEMYDKAERADDLEDRLNIIDGLSDDADQMISEIRGYANV